MSDEQPTVVPEKTEGEKRYESLCARVDGCVAEGSPNLLISPADAELLKELKPAALVLSDGKPPYQAAPELAYFGNIAGVHLWVKS